MLNQLIADQHIKNSRAKCELAEVLVGNISAQRVGRIRQVFATDQLGKLLTQAFSKVGDNLRAVNLQICGRGHKARIN